MNQTGWRFAFLMLAATGLILASAKSDFSGDWKMDAAQSDFGGSPAPDSFTRKIEQAGSSVILIDEQSSAAGHEKAVRKYTTDATMTTYQMITKQWMGGEVKSAAHWEGDHLVIVGKVDAGGTEIVITSTLQVSVDGKTLTESGKITAEGNDVGAHKLVLVKP